MLGCASWSSLSRGGPPFFRRTVTWSPVLAPIACSLRFAPLLDVASDGASPPRPAKSSALTSNSIHTSGGARRRPSPLPRWEECGPSPKDERAGRRGHPSTSNEAPRYIGCLSFGIDRECLSPARPLRSVGLRDATASCRREESRELWNGRHTTVRMFCGALRYKDLSNCGHRGGFIWRM